MKFEMDQIAALQAPLNKAHVKERTQAGRSFSYVEAWHAIAEANRIFGFAGWNRETVELSPLGEPRLVDGKYRVGYRAKVRITVGDVIREGCGFGSGIDKDADQAHESALKEAESDAMKRALMTFGNPFGLALYDKTQANVTDAPAEDAKPDNPAAVAAFRTAISMLGSIAELKAWMAEHKPQVDKLSDADYGAVGEAFRARSAELKPKVAA